MGAWLLFKSGCQKLGYTNRSQFSVILQQETPSFIYIDDREVCLDD